MFSRQLRCILLVFLALCTDLLLVAIADRPLVFLVISLFYLHLKNSSFLVQTFIIGCLMLESLIITNHAYSFLFILMPIILLEMFASRLLLINSFIRASSYCCMTIIGYKAFYEGFGSIVHPYTLGAICVSIIVMKYIKTMLKVD